MAEINRPKAIILAISGASSSGKTTLARLLREVFPQSFILHEDDFYRPEEEIPSKHDLLDWDCAGSLNVEEMARALEYIHHNGTFPPPTGRTLSLRSRLTAAQPFVDSKEEQNTIGKRPVQDSVISAAKSRVEAWLAPGQPGHRIFISPLPSSSFSPNIQLCIVDGFLLFGPDPPFQRITDELLDIKFFMTVSHEKAAARRKARDGYVTLEGFWTDPPDYVEKIVWPNYAESHAWLFEGGDVEGRLNGEVLREKNILALPDVIGNGSQDAGEWDPKGLDVDMEHAFKWAVETLMQQLEAITSR